MFKDVNFAGDPWSQQPNETPRNYALFLAYRDMEGRRSVRGACDVAAERDDAEARTTRDPGPRHPGGYAAGLAKKWRWAQRAMAWDIHMQKARDEAAIAAARLESARRAAIWERRRQDSLENFFGLSEKARRKVEAMLDAPAYEDRTETLPDGKIMVIRSPKFSFGDASRLLKTAAEIQVGVLASATRDVETLSDEEIRSIATGLAGDAALVDEVEAEDDGIDLAGPPAEGGPGEDLPQG